MVRNDGDMIDAHRGIPVQTIVINRKGGVMKRAQFTASVVAMAITGLFSTASVIAAEGAAPSASAETLSAEQKATASKIYFERCAGCHGILRKGATGKNLEPVN